MVKREKEVAKKEVKNDVIEGMIYLVRGQKVMFDMDLASLYGVETKQLKRAVRRNEKRFPADFMFELTVKEYEFLRCQFGALKSKYLPYVFTAQGVAMLSGVLNSDRAIQVNIAIMRIFARLRLLLSQHKDLLDRLDKIEKNVGKNDKKITLMFDVIKRLVSTSDKKITKIGFHS